MINPNSAHAPNEADAAARHASSQVSIWQDLPRDAQQSVLRQLDLPQAAVASGVSRVWHQYVAQDRRWPALLPPHATPGTAHPQASTVLNRLAHGAQTQRALKDIVARAPFAPVEDACMASDAYFAASVADWQACEEALGNQEAQALADEVTKARTENRLGLLLTSTRAFDLPEALGGLPSLQHFLAWRSNLAFLPESLGHLSALTMLGLSECPSVTRLPDSLGNLRALQEFRAYETPSLLGLPDTFGHLTNLRRIDMFFCTSLVSLPENLGHLKHLEHLSLGECSSLTVLPESLGDLHALQYLELFKATRLTSLPESLGQLRSLQSLQLFKCKSLQRLPENFGSLQNLRLLKLVYCPQVEWLPQGSENLNQLTELNLLGCRGIRYLPEELGRLSSLQSLNLFGCKGLAALPNSFGQLSSLTYLSFGDCSAVLPDHVASALREAGCEIVL